MSLWRERGAIYVTFMELVHHWRIVSLMNSNGIQIDGNDFDVARCPTQRHWMVLFEFHEFQIVIVKCFSPEHF